MRPNPLHWQLAPRSGPRGPPWEKTCNNGLFFKRDRWSIKAFQHVIARANAYQQHGREVLFGVSLCWRWFLSNKNIPFAKVYPFRKKNKTKKTVGMMRMMSFQACFCLVGYGYMVLTLGRALVGFGMWPCIWWGATSCSIWEFDCKNINITLWTDIYFYTYSYVLKSQCTDNTFKYFSATSRKVWGSFIPILLYPSRATSNSNPCDIYGKLVGGIVPLKRKRKMGGFFSGGKRHWYKVGPYQ